ncbi:MAG TPA: hypothetical protein ENK08_09800, partial [Chloroflexi bacterium]|nr:hypothetical protein [Chloroflexota bacterium]
MKSYRFASRTCLPVLAALAALGSVLLLLRSPLPAQGASIAVDGAIDPAYGPPAATDSTADGNGNENMDLGQLYIAEDDTYFYFAFTVDADVGATDWGKYVIYVDTDGSPGSGATSDAWGRNVVVDDPHRPEYGLYSWVNCATYDANCTQFWRWTGSGWTQDGTLDAAALSTGPTSVLEWKVAKSRLGNPSTIWVEAWSTGELGNPSAQDTVNDPPEDWNAWDWSTTAHLACSTRYPGVKLGVSSPADGAYLLLPSLDVVGVVSPTAGVTATVDLNGTVRYTPTLDAAGRFTQPVALARGANVITVTARNLTDTTTVVRHVTFGADHDDEVFWDGLFHDSRDPAYRTPVGPVPAGTPVTLRLRAYANDLTAVRLRVYDDRTDAVALYPMSVAASDGAYDYWSITITPTQPTVLWYRFVVQDGADTDYYEDDHVVSGVYRGYNEGGPGRPYDTSPDLSFQLTVYDPAFRTPDWLKNGVVYQIFPDRFRNGDPTNDVVSGTHFVYGNPTGGITYTTWNSPVIDPRDPAGPFYNRWGEDFYGGDLQGVAEELDYLQGLGVTAIYLNPIFRSPSNHKYDTTSYEEVDPHLGGDAALRQLLDAAAARGMRVILDGVFNHTSSDSVYFDRYSRYATVGAYESPASPYFDWYTFSDWPDDYEAWWGYETLPVLQSDNPEVRTYIYSGTDAIAVRWVLTGTAGWRLDVGGDIDPGLTRDPTDDYWEGFRQAVKGANPEAVIVGEEWGDATPWLLGAEWDAVMNYRFRSAVLSFLRETHYEDNDNNAASYGGVLDPITVSQFDAWLHSLIEDYPPEALYAMLNLVGSHDTNRVRFVLSHGQKPGGGDLTSAETDAYQHLLALIQFTLPGAPTVYYGDEVGVESPGRWYNDKWEDDPYNRVPFPWDDTPGHYSQQPAVRETYARLGRARAAHPALRTGTFDTLLTDDDARLYAYGRKWISGTLSDAAVVVVNRDATTHTAVVDVGGYLGAGAVLTDALHAGRAYTVSAGGLVTVADLGPMDGALLVLASGDVVPPDPPSGLTAVEGAGQVALTWQPVADAVAYTVYRSLLSGGGYAPVATVSTPAYTDTAVVNGTGYYYVVTARDAAGNESAPSNEAAALPHYPIDGALLTGPEAITHTIGLTPTPPITGRVRISGVTGQPGPTEGLLAQVGFGPTTTPPVSWTWWVDAAYHGDMGDEEEFTARLTPEYTGTFHYVYRYSTTGGRDWVYADRSGVVSATQVVSPGVLHVLPSSDTTPPDPPTNLRVTRWGIDHIALAWDPVSAADLYAYDLYRWEEGRSPADAAVVARVLSPTTAYTDTTVRTGTAYTYVVRALDTSFNRSGSSNPASARAEQRWVTLTFSVTVPAFTPQEDTVYVAGDDAAVFGASWDPAAQPLQRIDATHWRTTLRAPEGMALRYKYTRGSWDRVEKWGWLVGLANRTITPTWGTSGAMTVADVVHNWRDPLAVAVGPEPGA